MKLETGVTLDSWGPGVMARVLVGDGGQQRSCDDRGRGWRGVRKGRQPRDAGSL